jgi:hypothetical protein
MKLSREDIKGIQTRIQYFDKTIIEQTLKLDLSKMGEEQSVKLDLSKLNESQTLRSFSVKSTEDIKTVTDKVIVASDEDINRIRKHITSIVREVEPALTDELAKEDETKED